MSSAQHAACTLYWLGLTPYQEAWKLQERLALQIAAGTHPPALLLLEHPHTFTFGRRGQAENLRWDEAECKRRGVEVIWVDRGGDVTYHGPGQLVGYPLLPLAPGGLYAGTNSAYVSRLPQADYIGYLRRLERMLIQALAQMGVHGKQVEGLTGVWVHTPAQQPAKIAAIGVKVDALGISRHGFALNVNPDMSYWGGIIACGLKDYPLTSIASLINPAPDMMQVVEQVTAAFGQVFDYHLLHKDLLPTENP